MPFKSVNFYGFRNLDDSEIDLLGKEVYFVGINGQGKSNILETLYLSSYGNSFRTNTDSEMICFGKNSFGIKAVFVSDSGLENDINIIYQNKEKIIRKNGKQIKDRKELINTIPCVLFCHEDLDFVIGSPERKRWFLDQTLSMYEDSYINELRKYRKILKTRNLILKEQNENKISVLDSIDIQLVLSGLEIQQKRQRCIEEFNTVFSAIYEEITGISNVRLKYEPSWKKNDFDSNLEELKNKRNIDFLMKTTMSGVHRDKIKFYRDNNQFIPSSSTGQRRILALLLRVSQANFYYKKTYIKPVLLMDDVLLELDIEKRKRFIDLLPEYDQLICTFLPQEPYNEYKSEDTKIYYISEGKWSKNE